MLTFMIFVFATILVVKSDTITGEDNDTLAATTAQQNSRDEGVGRKLTDLTEEITPVDDKSKELRSLILGLGIPSIILSSLAFLCMCVRGWQVEEVMRKVETLEQKIIEGNINKTKDDILDYVKKGLSVNTNNIPKMEEDPEVTREENLNNKTDESSEGTKDSSNTNVMTCDPPEQVIYIPPPSNPM